MFYSLIKRNSRAGRKESSLYFTSLIIAIIAFYVILSLENQDAVRFIKDMESDAIQKLMTLIPVLYAFSLFVISFLVFFTTRYQMERRSHELGMYLMMGMKRSRLFFMLIAEDMLNTVLVLLVGLPIAIFLSEIISLTVSRLIGIGILGHTFGISFHAILWTICGLLGVKLLILGVLSGVTVHREPHSLMNSDFSGREKKKQEKISVMLFWTAILLLAAAYIVGIQRKTWESLSLILDVLLCGCVGTFLLFKGFYPLFEHMMRKNRKKAGLAAFTCRQLQESVFLKNGSLATCSLLILIAFCCLAFGVSAVFMEKPEHIMDYTFSGDETEIREKLEQNKIIDRFESFYEMRIGMLDAGSAVNEEGEHTFSVEELLEELENQKPSEAKDILLNNLGYFDYPYLIKLSSYNQLLEAAGRETRQLGENEVILYANKEFTMDDRRELLLKVLKQGMHLQIDEKSYAINPETAESDIVTDRQITLMYGLIVEDELFDRLIPEEKQSSYWNGVLENNLVEKEGLIQVISETNGMLSSAGLIYESYIQNIGRHLFYIIAESYVFIYLGVIFLIIANTAIGTQFLMHQRKTSRRYETLVTLGSGFREISRSARIQIRWYFFLPVFTAAVSSVFGIISMANGLLSSFFQMQQRDMIITAAVVILIGCVIEYLYMLSVMRISDRNIRFITRKKEMSREE